MSLRKYIVKDNVEKIATEKYRENGLGITFQDIEREFSVNKGKAQRTLKYFHERDVLFTANDLVSDGLNILENKSPQQYFPTCIKAEIIEGLSKRKNVLVNLTEVHPSKASLSSLEAQKAQNLLDILSLLGHSPLYIHKLQLQVCLEPGYYADIQKDYTKYNKAKQHEEKIGTALVKYLVYPNGKTKVFVACSNNPFRLEDEADETILYSFLGQVRDRLLYLLKDPHERIVPPITKWVLTGFDINKDITVTDMLQLSAINIQLKDADRVFRLYIKSLGDKAVYRVEESVKMRSCLVDLLHTIRSPSELQNRKNQLDFKGLFIV
jgi:hypothetical protein